MTGSLRVYRKAARRAGRTITSTSCSTTARSFATTTRGASARCCWLPRPGIEHPLLARLGPEPFDAAFDARYLWKALRTRTAAIKLALMDNGVVVGVGNIYANEALFRAGIRPTTPARKVSRPRLARLVDEVRDVLHRGHRQGRQHAARLRRRRAASRATSSSTTSSTAARASRAASAGRRSGMRRLGARASFYCPACQR